MRKLGKQGIPDQKLTGDAFFHHYEAKLKTARAMAFITNVMYSLNWFLGFCALTWASAVILGGLLTDLSQHDYFSVVALLLLEAVQLSAATFFGRFVTWKLVQGTFDPQRLIYNDAAQQKFLGIARIIEQALQFTVIAIRILIPVRRLKDLKTLPSKADKFDGLKTSLSIFYVLVLVNGAIAGISVIFSKHVVPLFVNTFCLRKYYEKVVWTGMDEGILHAADFELLSWTFQMQADEYRRNQRALVVKELYGDLMKFLYYHPRNKGFEATKVAMESTDTFEREAAANIVGLWVGLVVDQEVKESNNPPAEEEKLQDLEAQRFKDKKALSRLLMQKMLLVKLANALDNDESGRAASVSFKMLVELDPEGMLAVRREGGNEMLADILMDRIHEAVKLEKPSKVIIDIKVMIPLIPSLMMDGNGCEPRKYCTQHKFDVLKEDLWIIVTKYASDLKRLQAVAAYAYYQLMTEEERKRTDLRAHLLVEPKDKGTYMLMDEFKCLLKVLSATETSPSNLKSVELPWLADRTRMVEVRDVEKDTSKPLPWLARDSTALAASFMNVGILVVCSILIMRYAHF